MASDTSRRPSQATSSSSDFYADAPSPQSEAAETSQAQLHDVLRSKIGTGLTPDDLRQDDGHESDADEDDSVPMDISRTPTPELGLEGSLPLPLPDPPVSLPLSDRPVDRPVLAKRKLSIDNAPAGLPEAAPKKLRLSSALLSEPTHDRGVPRTLGIPASLWQRIFMSLSPIDLVFCLRVCKSFNQYLTALSHDPQAPHGLSLVNSSDIWSNVRKTMLPLLPRPLGGLTEYDMLRLIFGVECQFCGKKPAYNSNSTPLNNGPGNDGVRVVWPFAIRSCGACLEPKLVKDTEILQHSSDYRELRLGAPHGLWTNNRHFIADSLRYVHPELAHQLSQARASKVYYRPGLEKISKEYQEAKELGDGAADEWRKGLPTKGKEAMADSARWERWELQHVTGSDSRGAIVGYIHASLINAPEEVKSRFSKTKKQHRPVIANGEHKLPDRPNFVLGLNSQYTGALPHQSGLPPATYPSAFVAHNGYNHSGHPQAHNVSAQNVRQKNPQEVEAARVARRAEIERRCRNLQPPLQSNVLPHMKCFQQTMLIGRPLTDDDWRVLEPLLLEQRETAEMEEHLRAQRQAVLQCTAPAPLGSHGNATKPTDNQHQQLQKPLRLKLGEYADDYINGQWPRCRQVDAQNASHFAASVLRHVSSRYTDDKKHGFLDQVLNSTSGTTQNGERAALFLSLESMKWVYEHKVRPYLHEDLKKLFICARCVEEKNEKQEPRAFEGLIQHYGSVHTSAFGYGNVAVRWAENEWPVELPFHTDPGRWMKQSMSTQVNGYSWARDNSRSDQGSSRPRQRQENIDANIDMRAHPPTASSGEIRPTVGHETLSNTLAESARAYWDALDGIEGLLPPIRIQVVIQHAAQHFGSQFAQMPPIDLFTEILAAHPQMRVVKNTGQLMCKHCLSGFSDETYFGKLRSAKKLYDILPLITHYQLTHLPGDLSRSLNWTQQMIAMPENARIAELLSTRGMDDAKLALIAEVFPEAFPSPLPRIGTVVQTSNKLTSLGVNNLFKKSQKKTKGAKKKEPNARSGAQVRDDTHDPARQESPEDEYDPRRPLLVDKTMDLARFDTDLARKPQAGSDAPQMAVDTLNLAPETLAILQGLLGNGMPAKKSTPPMHERERSPSVGVSRQPSATLSLDVGRSVPTTQPDLAAILAALTGQPQSVHQAPPVAAPGNMLNGATTQTYVDPRPTYQNQSSWDILHDPRVEGSRLELERPSTRHGVSKVSTHRPARESDGLDELRASLQHNTRGFEQTRVHTNIGVSHIGQHESPRSPPRQPLTYGPQLEASGSPPQYRSAHENRVGYAQPDPYAPSYNHAPTFRYIEMPERDLPPSQFQHERPAQLSYTDEHGRSFILTPIDSAPTPVRYEYVTRPQEQEQARRQEHFAYTTVAPTAHGQPVYDERRQVYYGPVQHLPAYYTYDDVARPSAPRA